MTVLGSWTTLMVYGCTNNFLIVPNFDLALEILGLLHGADGGGIIHRWTSWSKNESESGAGNGNYIRPCKYEKILLIGP